MKNATLVLAILTLCGVWTSVAQAHNYAGYGWHHRHYPVVAVGPAVAAPHVVIAGPVVVARPVVTRPIVVTSPMVVPAPVYATPYRGAVQVYVPRGGITFGF